MTMSTRRTLELPQASDVAVRAVRVVIAEDECMFRTSLRHLLAAPRSVVKDVYGIDVCADFNVVGEAGTGEETIAAVESTRPDLLLLDMAMPRGSGLSALRSLEDYRDAVRTIVLTGELSKADLVTAVQLGARGLVLKASPTELLFQAIVCVLAGQYFVAPALVTELLDVVRTFAPASEDPSRTKSAGGLTRREREVLGLVVAGYANKEIARTFSVSEETIKHHLTRMFAKVGASNRVELAMVATERGLVADA
jgi:two-component system nitrate/nitrite response regulator NarL